MSIITPLKNSNKGLPIPQRKLKEAQEGSRSAFDDVIAPYLPEIRNFVAGKVDPKEVDDLVQDIMLAAWRAIPQFDGRSRLKTWIFGISIHKIRDFYRLKSRRVSEVSMEGATNEPVSNALGHQTELKQAVHSYVQKLSASQAEVIDLYYHHEMTLAEVATVLDRNLNTVKYQFCQAHFRLAQSMKEDGFL